MQNGFKSRATVRLDTYMTIGQAAMVSTHRQNINAVCAYVCKICINIFVLYAVIASLGWVDLLVLLFYSLLFLSFFLSIFFYCMTFLSIYSICRMTRLSYFSTTKTSTELPLQSFFKNIKENLHTVLILCGTITTREVTAAMQQAGCFMHTIQAG